VTEGGRFEESHFIEHFSLFGVVLGTTRCDHRKRRRRRSDWKTEG
jgi:hypothetical protein